MRVWGVVGGEGVATASLPSALLPSPLLVPPPVLGRAGDVIHLLVRGVTEGRGGGRPRPPKAGGPQGEAGRGRGREKERGGGRRRREGRGRREWEGG